ncbi:MAG: hypothetical protein AB1726_01890 [Planctomycetota bacterium]
MPSPLPSPAPHRAVPLVALAALAVLLVQATAQATFADPDLWHEMALAREALRIGRLPLDDPFAFTPTVHPAVHHEWGTGFLLYFVATRAGSAGLLALTYAVAIAIGVAGVAAARRAGAGLPVLCSLAPIPLLLVQIGFSALRAQMLTLLFTAVLLAFLAADRRGRRGWVLPWLALHVLWVNLHGGFVVGLGFLWLHILEQRARRAPCRHLLAAGLAAPLFALVNPYGPRYLSYLARALLLDRSLIPEWAPVWHAFLPLVAVYAFSLFVAGYAAWRAGPARLPGLPLVAATAAAALLHQHHLSIYAVTWLALVPAHLQGTALGGALERLWGRRPRLTAGFWGALGAAGLATLPLASPLRLELPANPGDHRLLLYPVGAVEHLAAAGFRGNLVTPFAAGAFVAWKLHPAVRISLDGRYEVAFPPGAIEEHHTLYAAAPGWREILACLAPDAVLVPADAPLAAEIAGLEGWAISYRDDAYLLAVPAAGAAPAVDRRGQRLTGRFP